MTATETFINEFFGDLARAARADRGLTQAQVVAEARKDGYGLTVPMLSALENGRERWTAPRIAAVAKALGSRLWFLGKICAAAAA